MSGAWRYVAVAVAVALVGYFLYRAVKAVGDSAAELGGAAVNAVVNGAELASGYYDNNYDQVVQDGVDIVAKRYAGVTP